jgi:SAM-dependent methyltransferase
MYRKLITFLLRERLSLAGRSEKSNSHWCRVVMDRETEKLIKRLPFDKFNVLEISGDKWRNFGFRDYKHADFPEYDVCANVLPDTFDLVIAEQVFEHLKFPYRAAKHVFSMVKPGGYFLVTTPFLLKVHAYPIDCSRWTEEGLKYLLHEGGFPLQDIVTGSWGNGECVVSNFTRWSVFNPSIHSLENDSELPVVVWALARRTNE